jgi:hypothetical protein
MKFILLIDILKIIKFKISVLEWRKLTFLNTLNKSLQISLKTLSAQRYQHIWAVISASRDFFQHKLLFAFHFEYFYGFAFLIPKKNFLYRLLSFKADF